MADGDDGDRLARLMKAAQMGDTEAYTELMYDITPRVRRVVAHKRGFLGADSVEDLVQEILLSVHAVRATYDPGRPFIPWLLAITRNRLADSARRYARRQAHEVVVDDLDVTFSSEPTNPVEEYRDPKALRIAIEALPPGQRAAIEMVKLRDMSLKEAAAASGSSVGALKVATHRAMASLRKWMGDLGQACVHDVRTFGSHGWSVTGHWACFPVTVLVGALPAVVMAFMLRRGAPLTPRLTTWLGALAVAGLGNVGVRFIHAFDTSVIVLAWHVGAVFGVSALLALGGRHFLRWRTVTFPADPTNSMTRYGTSQHDR